MHVFSYVFKYELLASDQDIFHYHCKYNIKYKLTRTGQFVESKGGIGYIINIIICYYFILIYVYQ